jgi:hypothetical protein
MVGVQTVATRAASGGMNLGNLTRKSPVWDGQAGGDLGKQFKKKRGICIWAYL